MIMSSFQEQEMTITLFKLFAWENGPKDFFSRVSHPLHPSSFELLVSTEGIPLKSSNFITG